MESNSWSTEDVVAQFRASFALEQYADKAEALKISLEDLKDLASDPQAVSELFGIQSKLVAKKVAEAIGELIGATSTPPSHTTSTLASPPIPSSKQLTSQVQQASAVELPPDKFHYFCSHKVC